MKTDKKSVRKQMKYLKILKKFDFVEGLDEDAFYKYGILGFMIL